MPQDFFAGRIQAVVDPVGQPGDNAARTPPAGVAGQGELLAGRRTQVSSNAVETSGGAPGSPPASERMASARPSSTVSPPAGRLEEAPLVVTHTFGHRRDEHVAVDPTSRARSGCSARAP